MNTFPERYLAIVILSSIIKRGIQEKKTRNVRLPVKGNEIVIKRPERMLSRYLFRLLMIM
jgi:hypothetical protein